MTPLVLSLALTAPAQPPVVVTPPVVIAPGVKLQPQVVPVRPVVVVPVAVAVPVYQPTFQPAPQAVTLTDFSRLFTPTPGKHDVWFVHPVTGQVGKVCFVLPAGKLKEFEVNKRSIRFEFRGGVEVRIEFRNNGTVKVDYDN